MFVSRVVPGDAPQIAEPTPLFAGAYQSLGMEVTWDSAPGGTSFVMARMPTESRRTVTLYTNWIERWKRTAAARVK